MSLQDIVRSGVVGGRMASDMNRSGVWADPDLFSAHGDGCLRMNAQRSGHRGPRSRDAVAGSIRTMVFGWTPSGADTEVRPPAILSLCPGGWFARVDVQRSGGLGRSRFVLCPLVRCSNIRAQRNGSHGGSPSRRAVAGSIRTIVFGRMPSGADTEVRRPGAERVESRK
jgi:hypothetical protein